MIGLVDGGLLQDVSLQYTGDHCVQALHHRCCVYVRQGELLQRLGLLLKTQGVDVLRKLEEEQLIECPTPDLILKHHLQNLRYLYSLPSVELLELGYGRRAQDGHQELYVVHKLIFVTLIQIGKVLWLKIADHAEERSESDTLIEASFLASYKHLLKELRSAKLIPQIQVGNEDDVLGFDLAI